MDRDNEAAPCQAGRRDEADGDEALREKPPAPQLLPLHPVQGEVQGFWMQDTPACVMRLPEEAGMDSLMSHTITSPDLTALGRMA